MPRQSPGALWATLPEAARFLCYHHLSTQWSLSERAKSWLDSICSAVLVRRVPFPCPSDIINILSKTHTYEGSLIALTDFWSRGILSILLVLTFLPLKLRVASSQQSRDSCLYTSCPFPTGRKMPGGKGGNEEKEQWLHLFCWDFTLWVWTHPWRLLKVCSVLHLQEKNF